MLNEQEKQAFLNGAYGVTRNGDKCKLVLDTKTDRDNPYLVVGTKGGTWSSWWTNRDLSCVVSLWQDKHEPKPIKEPLRELPKPIYEIPDGAEYLYYLGSDLNQKLLVKSVRAKEHYDSALEHGRYYKSKDDVIQVIEMLTDKPYQE
ncbi:hypothetical protein HYE54_09870 [Aggregatibacter actinomycetemcomitans]|uniref:hypothetical protein n=1 Tax=Aggregatibacter actinomycetemcomitans TaxID=714 RepID=UPI00197C7D51|nr:hypothetical protein [Aggregatibacter actinomycetemcomitans]MBN6069025.1 hypothetical protein [Aggregatibacter actinomycetemcomitans]MBN6086868.1 hypothetical protein [Aggregatibacter actinomycetemcomitans]